MVLGTLATSPPPDLEQSFRGEEAIILRAEAIILRAEADANAIVVERQDDI